MSRLSSAKEMNTAGMLDPTTDVAGLAKKAFVHLNGVSDEWLQSLQVDKIAGGQAPADEDFRLTEGVKSGFGWYLSWAQGWAENGKVYAAFFSTIMTALFKVRDRVLAWQKGVIKW